MAKLYGDDLRRKFLFAYDQGEETLEELADRFLEPVINLVPLFAK